ncbi:hypothetical protein SAMN05421595_0305 [Austwickia chelonae]|uniref:Uncharacterized protein n=1 Tax=Austwickia chelonae NBRC 105200 TaxID=1184607 RepID=K6UM46_9MICO|nr:hypothetical protein [Austwickia chelonae]GAB77796.1 hypothetical protein AUCHE_08_00370 [Austwickia chelonae NBRC 105200]SEV89677.1 hypothetical protein SAMN05421595_0305 [Austwickia chelonae]
MSTATGRAVTVLAALVVPALIFPSPSQAETVEPHPTTGTTRTANFWVNIEDTSASDGAFEGADVDSLGRLLARQGAEVTDRKDFVADINGSQAILSRQASGCGPVSRSYPDRPVGISSTGSVVGSGHCTYPGAELPFTAVATWPTLYGPARISERKSYTEGKVEVVAVSDLGEPLMRERTYVTVGDTLSTTRPGIRLIDSQSREWPVVGTDIAADGTVVGRLVSTPESGRGVPFMTKGRIAVPLRLPAGAGSVSEMAISPNRQFAVAAAETAGIRWDARRVPQVLPSGFVPVDVNDVGAVLGRLGEGWGVWSPWAGLRTVTIPWLPAGVRVKAMAKINRSGQIAATVTGADGIDRAARLSP